MAKKAAQKADTRPAWKGFKNVPLTVEQKEAFKAWELADEDIVNLIDDMVCAGHKMTVSYNPENDSYNVSVTGVGDSLNVGYTMSAFAKEIWTAIRLIVFKHWIVCEGVWEAAAHEESFG